MDVELSGSQNGNITRGGSTEIRKAASLKEGVQQETVSSDVKIDKIELKVGKGVQLYRVKTWTFFSPAPLYERISFQDSILLQFFYQNPDAALAYYSSKVKLFPDRCDEYWQRTLWAIQSEYWPEFRKYMLSMALWHTDSAKAYKVGVGIANIADPTCGDPQHVLMPVYVFIPMPLDTACVNTFADGDATDIVDIMVGG